jgi:hypothetical protein
MPVLYPDTSLAAVNLSIRVLEMVGEDRSARPCSIHAISNSPLGSALTVLDWLSVFQNFRRGGHIFTPIANELSKEVGAKQQKRK